LQLKFQLAFLSIMSTDKNNLLFTSSISTEVKKKLKTETFTKIFILVDENTKEHCLPLIQDALPANYQTVIIRSGEVYKTIETCEKIWRALTNNIADRQALLINLGGGVICDMGGFCARTYKRGISFWNIPTTLLSQVDASIGGKLGIDFGSFKNHIGLFSQPDQVLIDSVFLSSLPQEEITSGYAEIIKHALIQDRKMFEELLSSDINSIVWADLVPQAVAIKELIVEQDPIENGLRKILNFGHTIGHAIESYFLATKTPLKHGEAIAIGMIVETCISMEKELLSEADGGTIIKFLVDVFPMVNFNDEALNGITQLVFHDKKNVAGTIRAALLTAIGQGIFDVEITQEEIKKSLIRYDLLIAT